MMEVNVHNDFISDMTDNGRKTMIAVRSVDVTHCFCLFS